MNRRWGSNLKAEQGGFTIVELLIVIVIIAILAAITSVSYNGIAARAQDVSMESSVAQWEKILKLYISNGGAPNILVEGTCLTTSASDFPAGGGFAAGECVVNTMSAQTAKLDAIKATSMSSLPRTVTPTITHDGAMRRGIVAFSASGIYLDYVRKGTTCFKSTDSAEVIGQTVRCNRLVTAT